MSETPAVPAPTASKDAVEVSPPSTSAAGGTTSDVSTPGCPICEFIEAGPCGDQHKVWVACRGEAKEQETDYVQHCADSFRSFFGCMLSHQDYYRPFLDAFHVDTDLSQEAIDKANARKQQEQQQEQQQQQKQQSPPQKQAGSASSQQQVQQQALQSAGGAAAAADAKGGSSSSKQIPGQVPAAL